MDQDKSMVGETSKSRKEDVFDFENLRNSLPTTNHQSERSSDDFKSYILKLLKVKAFVNWKRDLMYRRKLLLERTSVSQRSAYLCEPSTSHETEKNSDPLGKTCEALERMTLELPEKQNKVSSVQLSNRKASVPQEYCEQKRVEYRRNIMLARETDRLKRVCSFRKLSAEEMDDPERISYLQKKSYNYLSVLNQVLEEKKHLQKEIKSASKLLLMLKEEDRQLKNAINCKR